uniref:Variable lymphocyte receptor B, Toll-like receptor 9 chimera n=1 Tax=Eptatretus burgeri TaxID=7764 RepID=UPI0004785242|nr:Chain A, Variable lymphocyte receptor B, Toll-like receptor 9 chimera [synthetic construct]4QDH_B Chain B, Variable lymphocyte receptor B, Toll-like receptor 9 chimera [synthetic construct]
ADPGGKACPSRCSCSGTEIRCNSKGLTSVPTGIPSSATRLELESNKLQSLPHGVFDKLTQLTKLSLSRNNLVTIKPEMFVNLSRLQCLSLSHNSIAQAVNGSQFLPLTNLQVLDLSHNKLDLYHWKSFSELPQLQALDLSYNSQPFSMKGIGHNFSFVTHLSMLQSLSLAHNDIHTRVSSHLNSNSVRFLDFSGNGMGRMWDEGGLYLHFFQGLSGLLKLDLSQNNLHILRPQNLDNLPKSLKLLSLRDNYLSFFNWTSLSFLPNLEVLDLAGNQLKALTNGTLPNGTLLQKLDVSSNSIVSVVPAFFALAVELKEVNLSHNILKTVDRSWFGPIVMNLKELALDTNQLKSVPDGIFDRLTSLQKIWLHTNPWDCSCPRIDYLSRWLNKNSQKEQGSAKCSGSGKPVRSIICPTASLVPRGSWSHPQFEKGSHHHHHH